MIAADKKDGGYQACVQGECKNHEREEPRSVPFDFRQGSGYGVHSLTFRCRDHSYLFYAD